jgi:hypothetical protein
LTQTTNVGEDYTAAAAAPPRLAVVSSSSLPLLSLIYPPADATSAALQDPQHKSGVTATTTLLSPPPLLHTFIINAVASATVVALVLFIACTGANLWICAMKLAPTRWHCTATSSPNKRSQRTNSPQP